MENVLRSEGKCRNPVFSRERADTKLFRQHQVERNLCTPTASHSELWHLWSVSTRTRTKVWASASCSSSDNISPKCTKRRLEAGLCPDLL